MASYCEIAKNSMQSEHRILTRSHTKPNCVEKRTIKTSSTQHGYVHYFRKSSCEIPCMDLMYSYKITLTSNKRCTVTAYTSVDQTTMYAATDVYNNSVVLSLGSCAKSFVINFKRLTLVSNAECELRISITPVSYIDAYARLQYTLTNKDGHLVMTLPCSQVTSHTTVPLHRTLSTMKAVPSNAAYDNIKYSLNIASVLTITDSIEERFQYHPYSVKLPQLDGLKCKLKYKIRIKASSGSTAQVTVTAIESLSCNRYAILKNKQGSEIMNSHVGEVLEGELVLYPLPVDVGLHIHTPYGFSGDLGDDEATDLVTIEKFALSYSRM